MNFQQKLQQELERSQQQGGNNFNSEKTEYPSSKLRNSSLYFNKDNSSFTVRILPPATEEGFFAYPTKEIWLNKTNKNGKEIKINAVLPFQPQQGESKLTEQLAEWKAQERVPNNFNRKADPRKFYYVNVVQVAMGNDGNMVMEYDQEGQLMVRLLKLPHSAYTGVISKMADEMFVPQNSGEYGLIGIENAYPLRISKPAPGGMSYTVDVFQRDLGPLPNNWASLLEDLEYQGTPSEVYQADYVNYLIDLVNGTEDQGNNNGGGQQQQQGGFGQQNQPQQNFNQGGFNQQQAPQPPQQPQQSFNQGNQGGFNQGNQGGFNQGNQGGFNQPPQQPNANQAPPQQNFSQGGFNQAPPQAPEQTFNQHPVDMGDGSPFNDAFEAQLPTDLTNLPNVEPNQNTAPQQAQNNAQFQNVDDVLKQMQQNMGR